MEEKVFYFGELLLSCHILYLWEYDGEMRLIKSNCPCESETEFLINIHNMKERIKAYAADNDTPLIVTSSLSLLYIAAPFKDGDTRIFIVGPFLLNDDTKGASRKILNDLDISGKLKLKTADFINTLPVLSLSRIFEYSVMLHLAVTGKSISTSELNYENDTGILDKDESEFSESTEAHGTYESELLMLQKVRDGDMSYIEHIEKMSVSGRLGKLADNESSMRQYKNAVLVGTVLFSRAAIDGGLLPETSMSLCDYYFQNVEAASTIAELTDISMAMQRDYVTRVRNSKENFKYSKTVQSILGYIDLHIEEDISLESIAKNEGYNEYYLSKKFKAETGEGIKDYIKRARIERAKFLLSGTSMSIYDISDKLRFSSQSYFTEQFRKSVGTSPAKYREDTKHL